VGDELFQRQCFAFVNNESLGFIYERFSAYDFDDLILETDRVNKSLFLNTKAPFEKKMLIS